MKKSDMIAALTGYLMDYRADNPTDTAYNAQDLAEFVLSCVERQGMKPPETSRNMTKAEVEDYNRHSKIEFTVGDRVFGYFWDKEDENEEK